MNVEALCRTSSSLCLPLLPEVFRQPIHVTPFRLGPTQAMCFQVFLAIVCAEKWKHGTAAPRPLAAGNRAKVLLCTRVAFVDVTGEMPLIGEASATR